MPRRSGLFRMFGGALTCPPGFYCMDYNTVLLGVLVTLLILGSLIYIFKHTKQPTQIHTIEHIKHVPAVEKEPEKPTIIVVHQQAPVEQAPPRTNPDPRFAPLSPEQSYETPPDVHGFPSPPIAAGRGAYIPINIPTRGYPDEYQQVGLLTTEGGSSTSATPTRTILPLFGRKLITNRDRWNYYTRTDGMNPVQVPVQFKRRNCDNDNGCEEITEGDSVAVPIMGQSYIANVYRYSIPRYIPVV